MPQHRNEITEEFSETDNIEDALEADTSSGIGTMSTRRDRQEDHEEVTSRCLSPSWKYEDFEDSDDDILKKNVNPQENETSRNYIIVNSQANKNEPQLIQTNPIMENYDDITLAENDDEDFNYFGEKEDTISDADSVNGVKVGAGNKGKLKKRHGSENHQENKHKKRLSESEQQPEHKIKVLQSKMLDHNHETGEVSDCSSKDEMKPAKNTLMKTFTSLLRN